MRNAAEKFRVPLQRLFVTEQHNETVLDRAAAKQQIQTKLHCPPPVVTSVSAKGFFTSILKRDVEIHKRVLEEEGGGGVLCCNNRKRKDGPGTDESIRLEPSIPGREVVA